MVIDTLLCMAATVLHHVHLLFATEQCHGRVSPGLQDAIGRENTFHTRGETSSATFLYN